MTERLIAPSQTESPVFGWRRENSARLCPSLSLTRRDEDVTEQGTKAFCWTMKGRPVKGPELLLIKAGSSVTNSPFPTHSHFTFIFYLANTFVQSDFQCQLAWQTGAHANYKDGFHSFAHSITQSLLGP